MTKDRESFKPHVWGKSELQDFFYAVKLLSPMYGANILEGCARVCGRLLSPMYGANLYPV